MQIVEFTISKDSCIIYWIWMGDVIPSKSVLAKKLENKLPPATLGGLKYFPAIPMTWQNYFRNLREFNVNPTSSLLKSINLSKCIKFSSLRKLEVADKFFGVLTKSYFLDW